MSVLSRCSSLESPLFVIREAYRTSEGEEAITATTSITEISRYAGHSFIMQCIFSAFNSSTPNQNKKIAFFVLLILATIYQALMVSHIIRNVSALMPS
jgi:hypothetical protein